MEYKGHSYGSKLTAYQEVAQQVRVNESTVRRWVADYDTLQVVKKSQRGRHSKVDSPIVTDPDFRAQFKNYVKNNSRKRGID